MNDFFSKQYHRHIDAGILANPNATRVYVYMLRHMAFGNCIVPYGKTTVSLKDGQTLAPQHKIAVQLNLTEKQVRGALKFLQDLKIIVKDGSNHRANGLIAYRFTEINEMDQDPLKRANPRAKKGRSQGEVKANPNSNNRDLDTVETENTPVGAKAQNPFGELMSVFKDFGVVVTEKDPKRIGLVNSRGKKLGKRFQYVARDYCQDEYCRKGGLSVNGFLNNMDRIASKMVVGTKASEEPRTIPGANATEEYLKQLWGE